MEKILFLLRKILVVLILVYSFLVPIIEVTAQPFGNNAQFNLPNVPLLQGIERIGNFLFTVLLAIAVIFIVIAGVRFVTAGGDPEQVKSARDMILYAVVGLIIAILARGAVTLIKNMIGGGGGGTFPSPPSP
jgi:prolipoprotein diacylglyceryltransferase